MTCLIVAFLFNSALFTFRHAIDKFCPVNMSEKVCLQWNDFQENIKSAFGNLREDNDFADVTLACEDHQQVEAYKVILAGQVLFNRLFHSQ